MKKMEIFFALFFFSILLFCLAPVIVKAQQPTYSPTLTPSPAPVVEYTLPYPGLLPDSPLYFLKAFRDRIIGFLISDPIKKAEFDLLQADKRLASAAYLINESPPKAQLAIDTVSKGENYFDQGIDSLNLAKKQGIDISSIEQNFYLSSQKHLEIIQQMEGSVSIGFQQGFNAEEQRVKAFQKRVSQK